MPMCDEIFVNKIRVVPSIVDKFVISLNGLNRLFGSPADMFIFWPWT